MSQGSRASGGTRGTPDLTYDLMSVAYHSLQGAETYGIYLNDAQQEGNEELARFFQEAQQESLRRADRAKELLKQALR